MKRLLPLSTLFPYTTLFRSFGIPVCEDNTEVHSCINPSSDRANYLKDLDLIVWEELPMSNKSTVECVNKLDRKSTRLNSSHRCISYAVFCLKKKTKIK